MIDRHSILPPAPMISTDAMTGMKLARMGQFAEALPFLEHANRDAPADLPVLHTVASLLLWAGRGSEAAERYQFTAALFPQEISVLSGWARALLLTGERDRAWAMFERALALDPDYAKPGGLLDTQLREALDADALCDVLQVLVDRQPSHPGLLGLYAEALQTAERLPEARAAHERCRELCPLDPLPHVKLGGLASSHGDTVAALAHYRSALEIRPDHIAAIWGCVQVGGWRLEPETLAQVERLAQSEHPPRDLAALHEILARHHDRVGNFAAASVHWADTNALMAQTVPPPLRYNARQHETDIGELIGSNTAELFQRLRDAGRHERQPVFVIGLPRSGTTLLEQMLASHPDIVGVGEQAFAKASLKKALAASGGQYETLTAEAVHQAAAWHLQVLDSRVQRMTGVRHAHRVVDKLPDNYLLAGWLSIAFPKAAIIHCLRDPRDVALSCWMTQFTHFSWSHDLQNITHRIEQHRRLLRHWRHTLGNRLVEIRYERLIADPETELRDALAAIRLDWHPDMLAFAERKHFVASASKLQVREPIHARSVARWRNYAQALQPVLHRLHAIAEQDAQDFERKGAG